MMKQLMFIVCFITIVGVFGKDSCDPPKLPGVHQLTKPVDHGEGPSWDARKGLLYYVDIHTGTVFSYEYCTGQLHSVKLNGEVTPVVPLKKDPNVLIVGLNRSLVAIEWDGKGELKNQKILSTISQQFPNSRFNDGKADKEGRLWFGTMGFEDSNGVRPNEGVLYKFTKDNLDDPAVAIAPVTTSNGLAWNKNNDKLFYIDTASGKVVEYQYDNTKGEISNPRVAFDMSTQSLIRGYPDGMTIDEDDNLWIALYSGGAVIKVDPKVGKILQIIPIPAQAVTSAMWGGPNLDILFVTTSRYNLSPEERLVQTGAGALYAVTDLGTRGLPVFEADIIDSLKEKCRG